MASFSVHGFPIPFTAPRIFPPTPRICRSDEFPNAYTLRYSALGLVALFRRRGVPGKSQSGRQPKKAMGVCSEHTPVILRSKLRGRCTFARLPDFLHRSPDFPPLPGFAGRTGSRTLTRCDTAPSALLPCSGGAVCPEKANPEGNRKSNGRVFRTHAHYDVEQIAASVPLICPRHAAFIGFRNFICSYICRPCAPRMPHGFIIGCVGFVPALRIPPCPVLSSGAPVGRRPCAPKKHVFRI